MAHSSLNLDSTFPGKGGDMRRLITYFNALFLGVILGMIFVAIVHASPADRQENVRACRLALRRLVLHQLNTDLLNRPAKRQQACAFTK
jgi:hypothetical protein